jgi:pimeloyl-ACP methyl ester carboxylesterase
MSITNESASSPSERPLVVLLHSSAASGRQWKAAIEALQPRYEVHAVDFHGHGARSDWPAETPLRLADDAALVEPFLARTGGAHVVGHSYGGAVALKLATLHPQRVRSLLVYEPVMFRLLFDDSKHHPPLQGIVSVADFMRLRIAQGDPSAAARRFVDFWSGDGTWSAMAASLQQSVSTRIHSVVAHFDALFAEPSLHAAISRLCMPVLALTGGRSLAVMHRIADILRAALPKAHHEVVPETAHMGPITHAAEINRRISQFLGTVTG